MSETDEVIAQTASDTNENAVLRILCRKVMYLEAYLDQLTRVLADQGFIKIETEEEKESDND